MEGAKASGAPYASFFLRRTEFRHPVLSKLSVSWYRLLLGPSNLRGHIQTTPPVRALQKTTLDLTANRSEVSLKWRTLRGHQVPSTPAISPG
jgi:hypothetical protein